MTITTDNYKNIVPEKDQNIIYSLLLDILELNNSREGLNLYLDIQDYHNEYSDERIEPCPDYYGTYSINFLAEEGSYNSLVYELSAEELDVAVWSIYKFNELFLDKNKYISLE